MDRYNNTPKSLISYQQQKMNNSSNSQERDENVTATTSLSKNGSLFPSLSSASPRALKLGLTTLTLLAIVPLTCSYLQPKPTSSRMTMPAATSSRRSRGWTSRSPPIKTTTTRLHSSRDLMEVKGLPKANIMRTNSSAYVLEAPQEFDLGRSVTETFEDVLLDLTGSTSIDFKKLAKSLPLPAAGVISSAALIAGCMIGAGVLALPSVTIHSGLMPSTAAIAAVWAYCAASGLLIGEVCINARGSCAHASYLKIAGATVGKGIANLSFALFSIFQYFLLAAYISQGGSLIGDFIDMVPGIPNLDPMLGPATFTAAMAAIFVTANQKVLEGVNNAVVGLVVVSFAMLLMAGMGTVDSSLFHHVDVSKLQDVVPVAMCALVFQNVVPVVAANLGFDRSKVMSAILLGSGLPAFMYLTWNAMVLGNVSPGSIGPGGLDLYGLLGGGAIGMTLRVFSIGAIATSFVGCFLSIVEEFNEFKRSNFKTRHATNLSKEEAHELMEANLHAHNAFDHEEQAIPSAGGSMADQIPLLLCVLLPPIAAATLYPDGFLGAIESSGGFGDPILFGLLPVIMAWRQRYGNPEDHPDGLVQPLVPGGKAGLIGLGLFAGAMLLNKGIEVGPHLWDAMASISTSATEVIPALVA